MNRLFHPALLLVFALQMCSSCQNGPNRQEALVERVFDIRVPSGSHVQIQKNSANGTFAVVRMPAATFAIFQGTCTNYSVWHPIQDGQVFEATGFKFVGGSDLQGLYSVGRIKGGLMQVLIWNERSESLLAMLSEGVM